jgi:hypothetical protein
LVDRLEYFSFSDFWIHNTFSRENFNKREIREREMIFPQPKGICYRSWLGWNIFSFSDFWIQKTFSRENFNKREIREREMIFPNRRGSVTEVGRLEYFSLFLFWILNIFSRESFNKREIRENDFSSRKIG